MILTIRIFDALPFFLLKIFFSKYKNKFDNKQNKFSIDSIDINKRIEILIWMDYSGAIGDFFSILKVILEFDKMGKKYSLLVNKKFERIVETLNLKNASIIYKINSLGAHYSNNNDDLHKNINLINTEFMNKKIQCDVIYYFNGVLLADALIAIDNINYNKIVMLNPKIFLRGKNSKFIDRNFMGLSLSFLLNKKNFNIEIINEKELNNKSINFIISYILKINNNFDSQIKIRNDFNDLIKSNILISAGASNDSKVLKEVKLISLIDELSLNGKKCFVGSNHDKKFIKNIFPNPEYKFQLNISLMKTFELVQESDIVISYDTGLYHIAGFLNKKIYLIANKNDFAYKYMRNYWMGNQKENEIRIILPKKFFY